LQSQQRARVIDVRTAELGQRPRAGAAQSLERGMQLRERLHRSQRRVRRKFPSQETSVFAERASGGLTQQALTPRDVAPARHGRWQGRRLRHVREDVEK
jgi:hypothetical protein